MSLDRAGILIFRDKISLHNFFRQCKQTKKNEQKTNVSILPLTNPLVQKLGNEERVMQ